MAKVNLDITAKDKGASSAVKGVTKSLITATLAIEGIKIATKALINVGKESIELFKQQEKAEKQLETVIKSTGMAAGVTAEEMKELASSLQEVTNFGDEAIIEAESLLLTFTKIGKDVIPTATETILNMSQAMGTDLKGSTIQLGKALNDPIKGITALSRVGVQLTDDQKDMIKTMQEAGDVAGAQAVILAELETQFGGSARAARQTFGGALESLKNIQGDNLEAFGKIISVVGKDFVNSMTDSAKAVNDFLTNTENVAKVAASFEVLKAVIKPLAKEGFGALKNAVSPITDLIKDLFDESKSGVDIFQILGGTVQTLAASMKIWGQLNKLVIQSIIDISKVTLNAIKVVGDFFLALAGKKKWEDVQGGALKTGEAIATMANNLKTNVIDTVKVTVDAFKELPTRTQQSANAFEKVWAETNAKIKDDFKKTKDAIKEEPIIDAKKEEENLKGWGGAFGNAAKLVTDLYSSTGNQVADATGNIANTVIDGFAAMGAIMLDETKSGADKAVAILQGALGAISSVLGSVQSAYSDHYNTLLEQNAEYQETQLSQVDDWINREMEMQGVRLATKQEQLQEEIGILQGKINTEQNAEEKARMQAELDDKKSELAREKILAEGEKRKADIQKKGKDKETALKKKQFEENKAFQIANIWISAASAVIGWWASFAPMGIPGIVLAGVMSAATLAMAGVQTGLVASQTFHGQEGGVVPNGTGSGDRAVTFMNKGEALLRNDDFNALVGMAKGEGGGGGDIFISELTVVANSPEELSGQLIEIQRQERGR